jgi:hypothetical protein
MPLSGAAAGQQHHERVGGQPERGARSGRLGAPPRRAMNPYSPWGITARAPRAAAGSRARSALVWTIVAAAQAAMTRRARGWPPAGRTCRAPCGRAGARRPHDEREQRGQRGEVLALHVHERAAPAQRRQPRQQREERQGVDDRAEPGAAQQRPAAVRPRSHGTMASTSTSAGTRMRWSRAVTSVIGASSRAP